MSQVTGTAPLVDRARESIARGDWQAALDLLGGLEAGILDDPDALDLQAHAAYGAGRFEAAISAWEDAHRVLVGRGEHVPAAGVAATIAMYLMMDTGLMAPVRGWLARAERLLEEQDEAAPHAVIAMVRTYERFMCGDVERSQLWADRAVVVGGRQGVPAAVAIGRVASARLRIFAGDVEEGLRLLDETAVALLSGELDPLPAGVVYCELICAMQGLAQFDRAEEWTEAMERWRTGVAFGAFNGRCRVHRAEIMRLRGSCAEAEEEALHACEELRPWMRREFGWPLTELGTIRLRRGDLDGAEESFLAAHANGWDPEPGLALLRLAQGDVHTASALIRNALDHPVDVPSKERPPHGGLRRAPLLDAQVEIAVAAGDTDTAQRAAAELTEIAGRFRSNALQASAALARARCELATDRSHAAVASAEEAVAGWADVGAPYEAAVARMLLGEAHCARGDVQLAQLEREAARDAFERIGAVLRAADASRLCAGAEGPASALPAPTGRTPSATFRLEGDTREIDFDGRAVVLRDLKGMHYLARLLGEPGREFHVLDLVAVEQGTLRPAATHQAEGLTLVTEDDAGPVIDDQAREAYRRRLAEVEEDIEEAIRLGDDNRVTLAEADRDFLVAELASAFGLGGRARRVASTSERARASVTRALRYALARIAEHHPALADHLDRTVTTGTYCSYSPDPRAPLRWQL